MGLLCIISIKAYDGSETSAAYTPIANLVLPLMVLHLPKGERRKMVMWTARMPTRTHIRIHPAMATTILHLWPQSDEGLRLLNAHLRKLKKHVNTR